MASAAGSGRAMASAAGSGGAVDRLTRTDLRDELAAFAEVVLQRHLTELAGRVQQDLRKDMELLFQEHLAGSCPQPAQPETPSRLARAALALDDGHLHHDFSKDTLSRGGAVLRRCRSEADMTNVCNRIGGSLQEAVLGDGVHNKRSVEHAESDAFDSEGKPWQGRAKAIVHSMWFERASSLLIFLNAIFIGVLTDVRAQWELQNVPTECQVIEIIFIAAFMVELGIRLFAYRCDFFKMELDAGRPNTNFYWNILDCLVVGLQVVEVVAEPFITSFELMARVSVLRLVRLVRLVRIVRVVKILRWVGDLRMIVYGIWRSMSLFFWAIMALLMMNYVCSVYFTVLTHKLHGASMASDIDKHFGSLGSTMISLFMAVTGGRNWGDLTDVLSERMDFWVMGPFLLYMASLGMSAPQAFTLYAVLNVIGGVFLETAMESARDEKEFYVVCNARMVFGAADHNGNGTITWPDLERALVHKDVRRFFSAVDIDISEAKALFKLLDTSGDGYISADEFIDGCLRVKGPSKSLDLLVLQREVSQLIEKNGRRRRTLASPTKPAAAWKLPKAFSSTSAGSHASPAVPDADQPSVPGQCALDLKDGHALP